MIIDRYDPINVFELVPKLSLEMDPVLAALDQLLDDDVLFEQVKADFARRYPNTSTLGRHSKPVEVILRMLVVRRLYDWSYEETEHFVSDSLVLRQFCRLYLEPAPDDTTLIRWVRLRRMGPTTLEKLNEHVVKLAQQLRVTRGRKLRSDSTVVETNIHYPRDSRLLSDGVRVVSRLIGQAKKFVSERVQDVAGVFRNRTPSAKRMSRQIAQGARRVGEAGEEGKRGIYRRLLKVAKARVKQAETVQAALANMASAVPQRLQRELGHFVPLLKQVIVQTRRRVLEGDPPEADGGREIGEPVRAAHPHHPAGEDGKGDRVRAQGLAG